MLGIITSIACGLSWSVASFTSGFTSRKMSAPLLTALYNVLGVVFFGSLFLLSDETSVTSDTSVLRSAVITGVIGGLGFALGLVCIAQGMSRGRAGIIGPLISVVSIALPVLYIALTDEVPGIISLIGIGLLLVVPYLASRTKSVTAHHVSRSVRGDVLFGIGSGFGFAVYFISLIAAPEKGQLLMLTIIQVTSLCAMLIVHIISQASWHIPTSIRYPVLFFLVLELAGVIFLRVSLNLTSGAIVTAVSGSIEPIVILVLARFVNKEMFSKPQIAGFIVMVTGIVFVSMGS